MGGKFIITKGKDSRFYFNLKAGNGVMSVGSHAPDASVVDESE